MSITAYGAGARAAARSDESFRSLKSELGALQGRLTTGLTSQDYAGLGAGVVPTLSARSALSAVAGYTANVADAQFRVKLASQGVAQIATLADSLTTSLPGTYRQTPIGQTSAETSAADGFKQVLDILNTDVNGRYLFSGRAADTAPVLSYDVIMNGEGGRAGLKQVVAERKEADAGPDGMGRLVLGGSGTGVTLSEAAAGLPFGMKILSAAATGSGVTGATGAGPPASATLSVAAQPAAGDTVTVRLGLPDGSETALTLTASASAGATGSFAIGATASDTAANLKAALGTAVATAAATTLASASALKAATDFFAGSPSSPPARVAGPPFATATATTSGTEADTVIWYRGDDAAGSARETAPVRTGDGTAVAIGLRANEPGFQAVLASLGALAADTFTTSDATSQARYAATAERIGTVLGRGDVRSINVDLSVANAALGQASDRLALARTQYEDTVASVENADPTKVATELLATQTRLQASYQATAAIAKLTLVNYL